MPLNLLMLGTGEFALPAFQALIDSQHRVVGLITQPARTGRGHHRHVNSMKETALAHGITVFQPPNVNLPESLDQLRQFHADLFVVAAYGQILSAELLAIPPRGAINLHASLLPKYRGAAPIQYAVLNGETETGVTIFQIEPKLDAGTILGVVSTNIGPKETSGELETRLARLAAPLTLEVVHQMETGTTRPVPQDKSLASKAPKMPKARGEIDWRKPSRAIGCHLRAMQPWPMPFTFLHSPDRPPLRLLILDAEPCGPAAGSAAVAASAVPGTVLDSPPGTLRVKTGDGALDILMLQPAGKRAMSTAEFLRGCHIPTGCRFGPESSRL